MVGGTESNASGERNKPEQKDKGLHLFPNHGANEAQGLVCIISWIYETVLQALGAETRDICLYFN